jgi:hypothetical protein
VRGAGPLQALLWQELRRVGRRCLGSCSSVTQVEIAKVERSRFDKKAEQIRRLQCMMGRKWKVGENESGKWLFWP